MPITPTAPYPKNPGDPIRSTDWNQAVDEVIRLDNAKLDRAGDTITGDLFVDGDIEGGNDLDVAGRLRVTNLGQFDSSVGVSGELTVGGGGSVSGSLSVTGTATAGSLSVTGTATAGSLTVNGNTQLGETNSSSSLTTIFGEHTGIGTENLGALTVRRQYPNYLTMGDNVIDAFGSDLYLNFYSGRRVNISSSANENGMTIYGTLTVTGDAEFQGDKSGYVIDRFINRSDGTLEEGDVVVLEGNGIEEFYGAGDSIPVPEVDTTTQAYNRRVCGIVTEIVIEEDADTPAQIEAEEEEVELEEIELNIDTGLLEKRRRGRDPADLRTITIKERPAVLEIARRTSLPLARGRARQGSKDGIKRLQIFREEELAALDKTKIAPQQIGKMAILGCYAHCKVDADIASIEVGDLLTTSTTPGHAQKADDSAKAIGAIVGKALASMPSGKGKIPVLVMLQ